jgi:AcrR family transcriptional regulator
MPKAFTEQEKELIGARLLEAGYRLFSAYGLRKTNVEEIAAAAGISKGAFYSFYESKEAFFMDVIEEAEKRVRQELLAAIDLPGQSPRLRLFAILKRAIALFEAIPILKFLTGGDFDLLLRRIPPETLQEHLLSDRSFFEELILRCREAGIPIQAQPEQIIALLYPLVPTILQGDNWLRNSMNGEIDLFLELVAAFCLGEVELQLRNENPSDLDPAK